MTCCELKRWLTMCAMVVPLAAGCTEIDRADTRPGSGQDETRAVPDDLLSRPEIAPDTTIVPHVLTGRLEAVDLEAETLTVAAADGEVHVSFSDATVVQGPGGPQGLADLEGTVVTVFYREEGAGKTAVSITLEAR